MEPLINFEGTRYEWRAVQLDKDVWVGEWRHVPRHGEPSEWKRYGALKSFRQDAEGAAYGYAKYLSRKM